MMRNQIKLSTMEIIIELTPAIGAVHGFSVYLFGSKDNSPPHLKEE